MVRVSAATAAPAAAASAAAASNEGTFGSSGGSSNRRSKPPPAVWQRQYGWRRRRCSGCCVTRCSRAEGDCEGMFHACHRKPGGEMQMVLMGPTNALGFQTRNQQVRTSIRTFERVCRGEGCSLSHPITTSCSGAGEVCQLCKGDFRSPSPRLN